MNQILSVVLAMVLFGVTSLGINVLLVDKTTVMLEAEASLTCVSIGQTMIDEAMTKSFDAVTANGTRIYDSTLFTPNDQLGPSGTESALVPLPDTSNKSDKYYNDFDDYNNYSRTVNTPVLGQFTVVDSVYYVSLSNLNAKVNYRTNLKRIVVKVTHPDMSYPVYLSDVMVYRKFF